MPYVENDGLRIHYEVRGHAHPTLLLHHGFGLSGQVWNALGYVAALEQDYRLILMDARGHGQSDKPHDPDAYRPTARVRDVLAVLDALGIRQTHFLGYSMGGRIGFRLAGAVPERVASLILGGAHPYVDRSWDVFQHVDGRDAHAFLAAFETAIGEPLPAEAGPLMMANDLEALAAVGQMQGQLMTGLPEIAVPCLLYFGETDRLAGGIRRCAARLRDSRLVSLPEVGHALAFMRSDLVLPHVQRLLSQIEKSASHSPPADWDPARRQRAG